MKPKLLLIVLIFIFVVALPDPDKTKVRAQAPGGLADSIWPTFMHDNQHTGRSQFRGITQNPVLLWKETRDNSSVGIDSHGGITFAEDGTMYISNLGRLFAYDPVTRQTHWVFDGGAANNVGTVGKDGRIYWAFAANIAAIDPSGEMIWGWGGLSNFLHLANGAPTIDADGNTYVEHDRMWSFDPAGGIRWIKTHGYNIHSTPAIDENGTIYITGSGGDPYINTYLAAMKPDGTILWRHSISTEYYPGSPAIGPDGSIILTETYDRVRSVNPDGTLKWLFTPKEQNFQTFKSRPPAIAEDGTVFAAFNTAIYSINPDGSQKWEQPYSIQGENQVITLDSSGDLQACALHNEQGYCFGLSFENGEQVWSYYLPTYLDYYNFGLSAPMYAADGLAYINIYQQPDNYYLLALADPTLYPVLFASDPDISLTLNADSVPVQHTVGITSTLEPLAWTATISPTLTTWLTINQSSPQTPGEISVSIDPHGLTLNKYYAEIVVDTIGRVGRHIEIPVTLTVAPDKPVYIPLVIKGPRNYELLHSGNALKIVNEAGEIKLVASGNYDQSYTWSPDGEWVAFTSHLRPLNDLYLIRHDGLDLYQLTDSMDDDIYPEWSPDGKTILFIRRFPHYPEMMDVCVINIDRSGQKCFTNDEPFQSNARWSPQGDWIAYNQHGQYNISDVEEAWVVKPDGTQQHPIGDVPDTAEVFWSWWPDGSKLLLGSGQHLFTVKTDGTGLTRITTIPHDYSHAEVSPDGQWISFLDNGCLYIMNADGTNIRLLDNQGVQNYRVSWSFDSGWIAYTTLSTSGDEDIWIANPYTGIRILAIGTRETELIAKWRPGTQ